VPRSLLSDRGTWLAPVPGVARALIVSLVMAASAIAPAGVSAQCEGEDCEVDPPPSSIAATPSSVAPTELLWPAAPPSGAGIVERPYMRRGHDMGLMALGVVLLSVGMAGGISLGIGDELATNCVSPRARDFRSVGCDSWGYSFIPFAGSILGSTATENGRRTTIALGVTLGTLSSAIQLVGLAFVMAAVHGTTQDIVPSLAGDGFRMEVVPYASASEGGLSMRMEL
jgi:hypothetical protein